MGMAWTGALAAALAAVGSGCAVTVPLTRPDAPAVQVPAAWSAGAGTREATSLAAWWQRFGDAALTRLVAQALQASTDIDTARAALRQSRALADAQAARLQPNVGASGSAQRSVAGSRGVNTFRAGFDAAWEPDVFGGLRAGRDAAEQDARASAAHLGDVQVSVAAEVALAYIALRGNEARLAIARDNLAAQQETAQITQWRVQAGLATSIDAEQARAAVEQTRAQVAALQAGVGLSRHRIALLCGRTVAELDLAAGTAQPQAPAALALAFPADTLRQRADLRAAEARVAAAWQRVAAADAARRPAFNLSGSLGLSALTISGLTGSGALAAAVLGSVSVPVLDGGAAEAQLHAQQAALEQARSAHRAALLAALKDVEDALVALDGDRERLQRLRNAADAAANAALLARQRYASGLIDFQTVLETQRSQLAAQDGVAASAADVASDHVRLYKALGGGWSPDAEPPARAAGG